MAYSNLAGETFEAASNFNLLVIPMFVLMGNLAGVSGMSNDLFVAAHRWMGQIFRGIWPFWFAMALMIVLLVAFPQIALYLPQKLVGN